MILYAANSLVGGDLDTMATDWTALTLRDNEVYQVELAYNKKQKINAKKCHKHLNTIQELQSRKTFPRLGRKRMISIISFS